MDALAPLGHATLLALLLGTGCVGTSAEQRMVERAALALGGAGIVVATTSLSAEGEGRLHAQGESHAPGAALPTHALSRHHHVVDFASRRWRTEQVAERQEGPEAPAFERRIEGLDGPVAYDLDETGRPVRAPAHVGMSRRAMLYHHPLGALRAALAEGTTLSNLWRGGNRIAVDVETVDQIRFTLFLDASTFLPTRVRSMVYHPFLGDVSLETEFGEYAEVEGLVLPFRIATRLDGDVISEIALTTQVPGGGSEGIEAPEAVLRTRSEVSADVGVTEVAAGVWRLSGDTVNSVVIELEDHLVLVEAPGSSARTLALIEAARRLRPGKPLRYLINTHHHFDHSAGIRAAVSQGLVVVTHERNRSFFEDIVRRPHTLFPDALERNPRPLVLEPVDGTLVMEDRLRRVEIHPVGSDPHASTMIMVYLPQERLLIRPGGMPGTLFEGSPSAQLNRERLLRTIDAFGLEVDHLLPLRGSVLAIEEVRASSLAADTPPRSRGEGDDRAGTTG